MVRIGIAGIGFMGVTHFKALAQVPGARVGAICTRSEKKLAGDWRDVQGNFGDSGGEQDLEAITAYARYDELIRDQSDGLLVPVDDAAMLAEAIDRVITDKRLAAGLAGAGRASHAAGFSEDAVVRRYLDFFAKVAS